MALKARKAGNWLRTFYRFDCIALHLSEFISFDEHIFGFKLVSMDGLTNLFNGKDLKTKCTIQMNQKTSNLTLSTTKKAIS